MRPATAAELPVRHVAPGAAAGRVRPRALTSARPPAGEAPGRTRFARPLLVETIVGAVEGAEERPEPASGGRWEHVLPETQAIVEVCRRMRSVAEIAAQLKMPLGVVRVMLSDLADQGRVRVYGTGYGDDRPDRALLERVLGGLRGL